jgi:hypothetical protein
MPVGKQAATGSLGTIFIFSRLIGCAILFFGPSLALARFKSPRSITAAARKILERIPWALERYSAADRAARVIERELLHLPTD